MSYFPTVQVENSTGSIINPAKEDGNLQSLANQVVLNKLIVGNARSKFRDNFSSGSTQPDPAIWTVANTDNHVITTGGNSSGATYLRISMLPTLEDSEVTLYSSMSFFFPFRTGIGISNSQRVAGHECFYGVTSNEPFLTQSADIPIAQLAITIGSNAGTITVTSHSFRGADRICVYGCPDTRLNQTNVQLTVVDANTITYPCTLANASYNSSGGYIRFVDPLDNAFNGVGLLAENTTVTNSSFVTRRNGQKYRILTGQTIATLTAGQPNNNVYTDSFNAAGMQEFYLSLEEVSFRSTSTDSLNGPSGLLKWTQTVPDESPTYDVCIRSKNLKAISRPIATVLTASKSGVIATTFVTNVPHNLTTSSFVQVYGVPDQTDFPNITSSVVSSVPTPNSFTMPVGTTTPTTASNGGVVWINHGSVAAPGVMTQVVQSISRTNNVMYVVGNGTWATPLPGEYFYMYGTLTAYDGAYLVLRVNTTTLELASVGPNFGATSCGGAVIRMTDVRIHFARTMDYTRLVTEVVGGRGNITDYNNGVPVVIAGSAQYTIGTVNTVTTVSTCSYMNLSTLGTITNLGTNNVSGIYTDRTTWATAVRSRIT